PSLKEPVDCLHNRLGTVLTLFCPCFYFLLLSRACSRRVVGGWGRATATSLRAPDSRGRRSLRVTDSHPAAPTGGPRTSNFFVTASFRLAALPPTRTLGAMPAGWSRCRSPSNQSRR